MTWSDDTRQAVRSEPVQHVVRVTYTHPSFSGERDLDFESGTLALDCEQLSFATASLGTQIPEDPAVLATLDPRTGARIRIYAGYKRPGRPEEVELVADLSLRERTARRPDNIMELHAESDEALLAGAVYLGVGSISTAGVREALTALIGTLPGTQTFDTAIPAQWHPSYVQDVSDLQPGDPLWPAVEAIADTADLWVFCDAERVWHIRPNPKKAGGSVWQFTTGVNGNITRAEDSLSVEQDYANTVVLVHRWRDGNGNEQVRVAHASAEGEFWRGTVGQTAKVIERSSPISQVNAERSAVTLVQRAVSRGRIVTMDSPSAYWVRPNDTVTVQLPGGAQERHLVSRVTFDLATGLMTVRSRLPEVVDVTTEEN